MIKAYNGMTPDISKAAFIAENAVICGDVILEEGVSIWYGAVLRGDCGRIHIGRNTSIQDNCVIHGERGICTEIGENVTVGHAVILHSCSVGDSSLIGMGSIIMNEAVIGDHCIVGAGSLVTERKTFAPGSLILGRPARVFKPVSEESLIRLEEIAEKYLQLGREHSNNSIK